MPNEVTSEIIRKIEANPEPYQWKDYSDTVRCLTNKIIANFAVSWGTANKIRLILEGKWNGKS